MSITFLIEKKLYSIFFIFTNVFLSFIPIINVLRNFECQYPLWNGTEKAAIFKIVTGLRCSYMPMSVLFLKLAASSDSNSEVSFSVLALRQQYQKNLAGKFFSIDILQPISFSHHRVYSGQGGAI